MKALKTIAISLWVIFFLLVGVLSCSGNGDKDSAKKENSEQTAETEKSKRDELDLKALYVTAIQSGVDRYVNVKKWPWGFDEYSVVDYDKESDKKVGFINIAIEGVAEKQMATVIFSTDGVDRYRIYSVVVGNKIFQDDGSYQSLLDLMSPSAE